MFSSPTLNVMVLTLLLSVFPLYLVVIKLGLTLIFILAILPLRARAAAADAPLFSRYEGGRIGIPLANILSPDDLQPPHWNGRGLATGDLDRDGYIDIAFATEDGPRLYRNVGGRRFEPITVDNPAFDIGDVFIVTLADLNNDGDLDLIANSVNGPVYFYRNNDQAGHAIQFRFDHRVGNRSGIGNKVIIHTADGGHQLRELKLGGGFQSFDAALLYFGLGEQMQIERIEVHWSSGEKTVIEGPLPADVRYLITRMAGPDVPHSEKLPRDH